ncbi:unnamed protein product [Allacma fusca]|uniref:E3 ubiquitin-protein ligase ZNRF1 n=1 Tax=Allacma fusca TaxID=39272 RepID=A0A8J2JVD7_9HEXA|nr:unnamed protein product [Allacma fusca]
MGAKSSSVSRPRTFSTSDNPSEGQTNVVRTRSYSNAASSSIGGSRSTLTFWPISGVKCPICSKNVLPDDIEVHLVLCLTRPRLHYNEDVLTEPKGECVICLEDLNTGDKIARLPCLCIYHKQCIDEWFKVNRVCPEHPD